MLCGGQGQQGGGSEGIVVARDKGPGGRVRREAATAGRGGYLDKPCKVREGDVGIVLARTFSSCKFSLAA